MIKLLYYVASVIKARQKLAKNRNVCGILEDFEPAFNAALISVAVRKRFYEH
jgi:hypothetical protein